MDWERFLERGFDIVPAENMDVLVEMREDVARKTRELVGHANGQST
jgi:hypothetical protein